MAHLGMSRILTAKLMPEATAPLTDREIQVLRWTADGKTASEIADILNISERTANFHIANAITKLNAPNKTAAVIRAGMLGMLG
ncbi:MAG: helix-turn-helix domain-containing protein [Thiomonas delicata]